MLVRDPRALSLPNEPRAPRETRIVAGRAMALRDGGPRLSSGPIVLRGTQRRPNTRDIAQVREKSS
jgi:hypothetical protein